MAEQSPERKRSGLKQFQTRSFSGHRSVIYSRARFLNTAARKEGKTVSPASAATLMNLSYADIVTGKTVRVTRWPSNS